MRYWFDTEFIERGPEHPIELLSIGIVAEDGREFYAQNLDTHFDGASDWVTENVIAHLTNMEYWHTREGDPVGWFTRESLAAGIRTFCDPKPYGKPEFWAYYADYDWVVFCQLFGTMMELPKGWPMYCRDIKQEADRLEGWIRSFNAMPEYKLRLPEQGKGEHHALADARWNRVAFEYLESLSGGPPRHLTAEKGRHYGSTRQ